jgi:hypothetical protein
MARISKFQVGDLVKRKSRRSYWDDKVGIIVAIAHIHGNPRFTVKWNNVSKMANYANPTGLTRVV